MRTNRPPAGAHHPNRRSVGAAPSGRPASAGRPFGGLRQQTDPETWPSGVAARALTREGAANAAPSRAQVFGGSASGSSAKAPGDRCRNYAPPGAALGGAADFPAFSGSPRSPAPALSGSLSGGAPEGAAISVTSEQVKKILPGPGGRARAHPRTRGEGFPTGLFGLHGSEPGRAASRTRGRDFLARFPRSAPGARWGAPEGPPGPVSRRSRGSRTSRSPSRPSRR